MNRQFTQSDVQQFLEAENRLRQAGLDIDHEHSARNGRLIVDYLQANPHIPVTIANICAFVESRKHDFTWRSPAQREYDRIAAENPAASAAVANWLTTQGSVGQLVNVGDDAFENASLLLTELRGRDVNPTTILQAIGRLTSRVGRALHFVSKPSKQVEQGYKPGRFIEDANVSPAEHQRRLRASQTQEPGNPATRSKREQAQAKSEAESLRSGYSHSEDNQISSLFLTDHANQIDWVATCNARKNMLRRFQLRREGVRI